MTRHISIDKFHASLDRQIDLTTAFTEKPTGTIIRICRLKPYDLIFTSKTIDMILYKKWIDEFGNSLIISSDKKPSIIMNDLSVNRKQITSSDLYGKLSIDRVAKISKLLFFLNGREEDFLSPHVILSFLGIDNYLRTFAYIYGGWQQYPSLLLGITALTEIANNQDIQFFKELKLKNPILYPCAEQRVWLGCWPQKNFVALIKNENDFVLQHIRS